MYDTLIIGLGCAGYTSAIYAARYKLSVFLVGQEEGGMGMTAAEVGNWPGDIEIKGPDLMNRMKAHAESFSSVTSKIARVEKVEIINKEHGIRDTGQGNSGFRITLSGGEEEVGARSIIFAMGSNKRHLGVKGEEEFAGRGVTYCATCDAFFYRGKTVAVIGGGDSAVEGAAIAAQVAERVYLIHRRDTFRAEPFWIDEVKKKENITFVFERNVTEIFGDRKVTGVRLDQPFEGKDKLDVDGVFIEVGSTPATELSKDLGCELDNRGFLKVGSDQSSSIKGVFGAGDVTNASNHFAQFATAAGEGAVATNSVFNYLQGENS